MQNIFFKIVEYFERRIETNEIKELDLKNPSLDIQFLNYALSLISDGRTPICLNYSLEVEFNRIIRKKDVSLDLLQKLILVKHLAPYIQTLNFDSMEDICSYICDETTNQILYDKWVYLNKYFNEN